MLRVPRDAEHLVRLALLFGVGVLTFLAVRSYFLPPGFGELGHFRTGAILENQQKALHFSGRGACAECHTETATALAASNHRAVGCESCHGALGAHAADPEAAKAVPPDPVALCAGCHADNPALPKAHPRVDVAKHAEGARCTDCHDAHAPSP